MLVLCVVALAARWQHIKGGMQYPRVNDELHIAPVAAKVLKTGDFHPGRMTYPGLPKYIAAAGMSIGFINAATHQEVRNVHEIGNASFPYYTQPRVVMTARLTFALLAVATMAAAGWLAWLLFGRPGVLFTGPLVLALSDYYFWMSWSYLNVDIVATFFVTIGLLAIVSATRRPFSLLRLAALPAACAGLAAASKYTHGLLLVPVVAAIALFAPAGRRLSATALAVLAAALAFVAANPFSVLDLPAFLNGLAYEARHYASGHAGHDPAKGLAKLAFYSSTVARDFGIAGVIAGTVGLCAIAWQDWRRTAVVASFAAVLLALLSSQRVEFARNILPLFPLAAIFIAGGVHFVYGQLVHRGLGSSALRNILGSGPPWRDAALRTVAFVVPCALALYAPLTKIDQQISPTPNSRHQAVAWIMQNLPSDTTLIVPTELGLDTRLLAAAGYPVRPVDFIPLDTGDAIAATAAGRSHAAVLIPSWYADPRFPNTELAARLNEAAEQAPLETIAQFGRTSIKVNVPQILVTSFEPRVSVAVPLGQPQMDER